MRNELQHIEKIERYLSGNMEGEELLQFRRELEVNTVLREEVEMQKLLIEGAEFYGLRRDLNKIHSENYDNLYKYIRKHWWKFGIGAFLLSGVIIFFMNDNDNMKRSLFENKADVVSGSGILYSDTAIDSDILSEGFNIREGVVETGNKRNKTSDHILFLEDFIGKFPSQLYILNSETDTTIFSKKGSKVIIPSEAFIDESGSVVNGNIIFSLREINKKSDILLNDLAEEGYETFGGIYLESQQQKKKLKISPEKQLKVQFNNEVPVHVYLPDIENNLSEEEAEKFYFKVFDPQTERRIIVLPAVVLDYDIIYTGKFNDPMVNERIESLLLPQYENSFTSTTQFHYRIEGCLLYGEGTDLIDIYLSNIHLKLWQADSIVEDYLVKKASADCNNFSRYMKASEYFRWLKSLRHGTPVRNYKLDYRNYRKGQLYNKLPDKVLERYLLEAGLTEEESDELIGYFKKMFFFKKMFLRQTKFPEVKKEGRALDYYYANEGRFVSFEKSCDGKPDKKYIVEAGGGIVSAKELNTFIPLKNLGWVSNERFIYYKNSSALNIKMISNDSILFAKCYVVFKAYDMVMGGKWTQSGENYFEKLPPGADIYVVAIGYSGDKLFKGFYELKTGEMTVVELKMEETSEENLIKELRLLDN
jgi:hypothetical protein